MSARRTSWSVELIMWRAAAIIVAWVLLCRLGRARSTTESESKISKAVSSGTWPCGCQYVIYYIYISIMIYILVLRDVKWFEMRSF